MVFTPVVVPLAAAVVGRGEGIAIMHRAWTVVLDLAVSGMTPPAAKVANLAASVTAMAAVNVRIALREWEEAQPRTTADQLTNILALLARLAAASDPLLEAWEPGMRWSWALTEMQTNEAVEGLDAYHRPSAAPHLYDTLSLAAYTAPVSATTWEGAAPDTPPIDAVGVASNPAWANGARLRMQDGALTREVARPAALAGGEAALLAVLRYLRVTPPHTALANGTLLGSGLLAAGLATPTVQALAMANGLVQPIVSGLTGLFDLPQFNLDDGSGLGELLDRAADRLYLEGVGADEPYALQVRPVARDLVELVHREAAGLCFSKAIKPLETLEAPEILLTLDKVLARFTMELAGVGTARLSTSRTVVGASEAVQKARKVSNALVDIANQYDGDKKMLGKTLALMLWLVTDKPAADAFKTLLEPRKAIWIEKLEQLTNPGHGADFFSNFDATALSDLVTAKSLDILDMDKDELTGVVVKDVQLEKDLANALKDNLLDKHLDASKLTGSKLKLNQSLK